jgi:hypothetical protein
MGIKVSEYLPLYGLLFNFKYYTQIDGNTITVNDLFEKHPKHELNEFQIDDFFYFDLFSLQTVLKNDYFSVRNISNYLRDLFDNYRMNEGDPNLWIEQTLNSVYHNPTNYRADLRTEIESFLISLQEVYLKLNPNKKLPSEPKKVFTLSQFFSNRFGKIEGEKKLHDLKWSLYKKNLLSEDLSIWIGTGMHGKEQLASFIKYIGIKFFQTALSTEQVGYIGENDFNLKISIATIKNSKSDKGEYYLNGFS